MASLGERLNGDLWMWTIYRSPSDFPGLYVLRGRLMRRGGRMFRTCYCCVADDADQLRGPLIAMGLIRLGRSEHDDTCIMETWI